MTCKLNALTCHPAVWLNSYMHPCLDGGPAFKVGLMTTGVWEPYETNYESLLEPKSMFVYGTHLQVTLIGWIDLGETINVIHLIRCVVCRIRYKKV